jgi:hypothetical protein
MDQSSSPNPTCIIGGMAIDDPLEAFDQQYMKEEPQLPTKLAKYVGDMGLKVVLPDGGLALDIMLKVLDALFNKESGAERVGAMLELVKGEFRHVETTKASHEDVQKAIQLAIWYDRHERDDAKRDRYVKLIGNALRSETQIQDIASFVQTIEQLNERDVIVLKVLNKIMNKNGDWKAQHHSASGHIAKLHPGTLIGRAQELTVQIAMALGQATEKNTYSREEGYGICNRLQGFGLAHELDETRELPLANYIFRLSTQGVRLLKFLGEDVPNYDYYFMDQPTSQPTTA